MTTSGSDSPITQSDVTAGKYPTISLFSGSLGFDLGLETVGFETRVCVEIDADCVNTIRTNRPTIPVIDRSIQEVSTAEILRVAGLRQDEPFCVVGGPPCQSFSSGGKRSSILDPRGSLFMEFVRVVREASPQYFVFENVAHIVTAAVRHRAIADRPGQDWNLSAYTKNGGRGRDSSDDSQAPLEADEMSGSAIKVILSEFESLGYHFTYGVLNAADFGVPQRRLRFVLIGSRVRRPLRLPQPTHATRPTSERQPWVSLRHALKGLNDPSPLHSNYTEFFQQIFSQVPPGRNWRALPVELQQAALGAAYDSGGGKTGFFRRLSWDEPTPTIVGKPNRKSCAICHPDHTRPLTVRECARVQGFPDDWQFTGGMHRQYLQVGNAVPIGLGAAVGRAILNAHTAAPESSSATDLSALNRLNLLEDAKRVLRDSARNYASRNRVKNQTALF
jgi:DNA (cytosine-5)-methyltransferase 1